MNFNKWFIETEDGMPKVYGYPPGDIYNPMKHAWGGCKDEVLKIISDESGGASDTKYLSIVKKISKL